MVNPTYAELLEENDRLRARIEHLESSALFGLGDGEDWVASFFEGIPLGLVHVAIDGAVKLANTEAQRILGLSFDTLERRFIVDFQGQTWKEDGSPCPVEDYPVARCLMTGQPQPAMMVGVQQRSGDVSWAIFTAIPTHQHGQEGHTGALVAFVDVTAMQQSRLHQREVERRLEANRKLEALGRLAGGVAHDMNNILAIINGFAHVLGQRETDRALTDGILRSCGRGRDLVRNLLGFARQGNHERQEIQLNALVEEVTGLLQRACPRNVELATRLDAALPPIIGDSNQFANALMNLCFNAFDACEPKAGMQRVLLQTGHLTPEQSPLGQPTVHLVIEDTGVGIPAELRERIVEPFFTTKDVGRGTGLGLSMVYGMIQRHGGELRIESEEGQWTRIHLHLPVSAEAPARPPKPGHEVRPPQASAGTPQASTGRNTVLLIDDDPDVLAAHATLCENLGVVAQKAINGFQAMKLLRRDVNRVDLVLLDLRLPDVDGSAIFEQIRQLAPDLPILLTSGYAADGVVQGLLDAGALDFLPKPMDIERFEGHLSRLRATGQ